MAFLETLIMSGLMACGCVSLADASTASEPECHDNERYHVAGRAYPDDAGNQFTVTVIKNGDSAPACRFNEAKADFVIGAAGDPLWFSQLQGHLLVLTRSTGPQGDLVVYDLRSGKTVLDVPADEFEVGRGRITFWERTIRATQATCPTFAENEGNGMGSVIAEHKAFDVASGETHPLDEKKCVAIQ